MYLFLHHICIIMFCHRILKVHLDSVDDIYKTGLDERVIYHPIINIQEPTQYDIRTNIYKKRVIDLLAQQYISIDVKIRAIDNYDDLFLSPEPYIYNGGLFDDWDFDF